MFKLSVKQEVSLLAILAIVGIVILIAVQTASNAKTNRLYELGAEVYKVKADMLTLRRNEKDFLARNDIKYIEKFNKNHKQIIKDVKILSDDLGDVGLDKTQKEAEALELVLNDYRSKFAALTQLRKKIGLDHKSGLYGSLRSSVHKAEEKIFKVGDYKLARDMLMLRRREKDFMLRLDVKYVDKFDKDLVKFNDNLKDSFMAKSMQDQIASHMVDYDRDFKELVNANIEFGLSHSEGKHGELRVTIHKSEKQLKVLEKYIAEEVESALSAQLTIKAIAIAIISLILIGMGIFIVGSITKPISIFSKLMSKSAHNLDLTMVASEDAPKEIALMASSYNHMISEFHNVISEISKISDELNSASSTLDGVSSSVSSIVENQLNESEKVAISMNEMTATTQDISLNANTAAAAAESADTQAQQGKDVVAENQTEVSTLAHNVNEAAAVISELSKESENIGTVLSVIREIAEQTNLLALNAAIEAARAGEQGRGFAVVADEVRTLAQRSQESTEEIKAIVERLQSTAERAVQAMETGKDQAQKSVERSMVASEILEVIGEAIGSIKDMNFQIATASEEQSAVTEEINRNVVSITDITKDTSSNTSQIIHSGRSLANTATKMTELIGRFKV